MFVMIESIEMRMPEKAFILVCLL